MKSASRSVLKRGVLALGVLLFDLWAVDVTYGQRRCRRKGGTPDLRDAVVVCLYPVQGVGHKSLEDAGWLGHAVHAWRMR